MRKNHPIFILLLLYSVIAITSTTAQRIYENDNPIWQPAEDNVFLQEVALKVKTEKPVKSIAIINEKCYALINGEIYQFDNNRFIRNDSAPKNINRLKTVGNILWAIGEDGLYRLNNNWELVDNKKFVDLTMHLGVLHAATRDDVFRLENNEFVNIKPASGYLSSDITMLQEDGSQLLADPVKIGPVHRIASYSETLYILRPGRLALFDGKIVNQDFVDWGTLPSYKTNDFLRFGNRLYISTDRGLSVLRGAALTTLTGKDGLPYEQTTCLEAGFDNDIWIGTTKGAIRKLENEWHYFGADHWLPGDNVYDIAVGKNIVYIATDKGVGIIKYEPYTLRKKAAYYERHINEWGHKRLGFIHTIYKKGDEWIREVSDNDGGHTAPYLVAMCYKYLVTKDEAAREEAVNSFYAMLWLERVTPIDGFIARSIWSTTADKDEKGRHGSGGLPAKWYPTDDGKWYWKGDTSSDEVIAHFYAVSLFHDLVAEGEEKELAEKHIDRIASYIVDNGWVLKDMDGKPTRWGRWNADYLLNPYGWMDKGVNGLEAQAIAKAALNLTNNKKYEEAFQQLMDWGYQNYTVRQKNTFPPLDIAPWDDNLAFRSYYTLLRYTNEPQLRSIYLRSLERTWEIKRMEHIAWFNFAYGAITGNDCELEKGVKHLREWTLDCTEHNFRNSHRDDLITEPGYFAYEGGTKAISPRELAVSRGSRRAIVYDGGVNGRRIMEPTGFLRDYWLARYHGMIKAPSTTNKELLTVEPTGKLFGAKPYDGPDRPAID